jgi:hypothetical protein
MKVRVAIAGFLIAAAFGQAGDPPASRFQIDKDRRMYSGIRDDERIMSESENPDEFDSYNEVFSIAHSFVAADLEAHARRDVGYRDLMGSGRSEFRLDLILVEGRLIRLVKRDATPTLASLGIPVVYEGWVFPDRSSDPICCLFDELPDGLTPALKLEPAPTVRFAGYSFKVVRYESLDPDAGNPARGKMRRAPLLIGKSVTVVANGISTPASDWTGTFVPGLLAGIAGVTAAGLGLAWWFRRGDRAARAAIAGRAQQNPFPAV